ncbi:MAG: hypothetical protein EOO63_15360 [Hymenobacter sp.]|nr:MAG: hypothetical protein EOO63_15360 [Hymenobacter sp.]
MYRRADKQNVYTEYNPSIDMTDPQAIIKIARMRPWYQYKLINSGQDSVEFTKIEAAVKTIQADTGHAGGVQVKLGERVPYSELVALLDMMLRLDQKRYWLDILHQPTTFYAITPRPLTLRERQQQAVLFECGYKDEHRKLPLTFSQKIDILQQVERRPLVLVAISSFVLLLVALVGQWLLR